MSEREVLSLKPQALVGYIESNLKLMIIDVRDIDYGEGGVIQSSINVNPMFFNEAIVNDLLKKAEEQGDSFIVLYCQYGQQRSVKCAKTMNNVLCNKDSPPLIQICYLEGGFKAFLSAYHDTKYVEQIW